MYQKPDEYEHLTINKMKRIIAVIVLATAVAMSAFAQPKAIGGRFGYSGLEASYQHYLGSPNFIEANLGLDTDYIGRGFYGFKAEGLYNITFAQPNWTDRGDWAWYAGAGIALGYVGDNVVYSKTDNRKWSNHEMGFMFSIPVQVGLSYTFWFPLQLSVDIRPELGLHAGRFGDKVEYEDVTIKGGKFCQFYDKGLWGFTPTLSVHYAF